MGFFNSRRFPDSYFFWEEGVWGFLHASGGENGGDEGEEEKEKEEIKDGKEKAESYNNSRLLTPFH